jgi:hypothetical protein
VVKERMASRSPLRSQIKKAWRQSITDDYVAQRINSERSLQASVWSHLNGLLPSASNRMFIEPRMSAAGKDRQVRYPDIVVCNSREVIGVIELKYQPRVQPSWRKDIETFNWIATSKTHITVSNFRFRGKSADARTYPLAKDVLCVWAGVHAECNMRLINYAGAELAPSFMELHAETRHSGTPRLR